MTPRKRVEISLRGGHSDRVPFTIYENKLPQCVAERELRNRGLCIVKRDTVVRTHRPNVKVTQEISWESGKRLVRTFYETPVGTLSTLEQPAGFTTWHHEKLFKSPDDYKTLLFLIQDERHEPNYGAFLRAQDDFGEDGIFRAGIGLEPMQALISGNLIAMQDFCIQWMDNRDEILKLYHAIVENHRRLYPLVAESPALFANYGGNVVPEISGPEMFREYYLPHYNEAAEVMHRHGKLIGCHYDDDCKLLAEAIAETDLDYVEAFTPAPGSDMTLAEARQAWPNKVLWLNFPSAYHLRPRKEIESLTLDLLDQAGSLDGFIMGVTEDVPANRWQEGCKAIMDGLERHAREKPERYA